MEQPQQQYQLALRCHLLLPRQQLLHLLLQLPAYPAYYPVLLAHLLQLHRLLLQLLLHPLLQLLLPPRLLAAFQASARTHPTLSGTPCRPLAP
jgi:hypothetical protein